MIKKIIFFIPLIIVLYFAVFAVSCSKIKKEEPKETGREEELAQYRETKPAEYFSMLAEQEDTYFIYWFAGKDGYERGNLNRLFQLKLEDNIPVLYQIDFLENKKIILEKLLLQYRYEHLALGYYAIVFQHRERDPVNPFWGTFVRFSTINGVNSMDVAYISEGLTQVKADNIDELSACFPNFNTRKEIASQYAGLYEFERIEIIRESKDFNIEDISPKTNINITFTRIGNLYIKFSEEKSEEIEEIFCFLRNDFTDEIPKILYQQVDHWSASTYETYYYLEDDYLIYYSKGTEYKIYYRKNVNGI
ncbi:MAG: hypothetical protein LBQ82_02585 [Treponema sp.]|jgi:hypothetical protein|nr:hypothetical protein [Treponema sp.]